MKVGTRSVLYGAHAFWLHPFFVFAAWWQLFGFPWDPRLWVAFFVHDLGYAGKPNMDGAEGEDHPYLGARIMEVLFDRPALWLRARWLWRFGITSRPRSLRWDSDVFGSITPWRDVVLYHSRFLAKRHHVRPSQLCVADKLAIALTPAWLYLPMVRATGEIHEYRKDAAVGKYLGMNVHAEAELEWYRNVQDYLRRWVAAHRDGCDDSWTPDARAARDASGVWS